MAFRRLARLPRSSALVHDSVVLGLQDMETLFQLVQLLLLFRVDGVDFLVLILYIMQSQLKSTPRNGQHSELAVRSVHRSGLAAGRVGSTRG